MLIVRMEVIVKTLIVFVSMIFMDIIVKFLRDQTMDVIIMVTV